MKLLFKKINNSFRKLRQANDSLVVGVDIGGSHITAAVVDLESKCLLPDSRLRKPVNSHGSEEEIIKTWASVIKEVLALHPNSKPRISIALPGPFDYYNGICLIKDQDKYEALYNKNVKSLLSEEMNVEPENIKLRNDAGSFIKGESFCGAVQGFEKAIGITLGTGLGSAVFREGTALDANLWKLPYKNGIAEDFISTRWFKKRYFELTGHEIKNVKELTLLVDEHPSVRNIFEEFGKNLAEFLRIFLRIENSQVIVIGGNISKAHELFLPYVEKELRKFEISIPIKMAVLGEDATILGAASSWVEKNAPITIPITF